MPRLYKTVSFMAAVGLLVGCFAFGPTADAADDQEARQAKILANLKLQFEQLGQLEVSMGEIKPTDWDGLDEGSFTVTTPQGVQTQTFLVSRDDTKLYMVNQPIDVSKTEAEIQAAVAQRAEEELKAAAERNLQLATLIENKPVRGNPDGKVTIVEFSDFQCPYCSRGAATVEQILEKYPEDVKFVFLHYPLGFHPWAKPAAIAAECAASQDPAVFWQLHDHYFENQKAITPDNVMAKTREFLGGTGLDMATWTACAEDSDTPEYKAAAQTVDSEMRLGQSLGVSGTPGFFVNGQLLSGAQPLASFVPLIEAAKAEG